MSQKDNRNRGGFRKYVSRKYGREGFTNQGRIKLSVLREIENDPSVQEKTRTRARRARRSREGKR